VLEPLDLKDLKENRDLEAQQAQLDLWVQPDSKEKEGAKEPRVLKEIEETVVPLVQLALPDRTVFLAL